MNSSPMDDEMKGLLDRADELAAELAKEYHSCAQCGTVTERAKNLFHDMLVKFRSALDFAMFRIYAKHSQLEGHDKAEGERRAGFPICDQEKKFRDKLKSLGLLYLETANPALYKKLRQPQPFATNSRTLLIFRHLSNLGKHKMLAVQHCKRRPARRFTAPDGRVAIVTEGVSFNHGKSLEPWPNCVVENVIWATFEAYEESGDAIFPKPDSLCVDLRLSMREYIQQLIALI